MKLNRTLAVIAAVLVAASIWTYRASVDRGERFERGQRFLPNLNPDAVAEIVLAKGDDHVTLKRGDDGFTVADADGYPAANEAVNRVLRSLVDLELEKKVGTGDDLYRELGLTTDSPDMIEIALLDASGQDMVRLRIGKPFPDGDGTYLRRLDGDGGPAYLSTRRVTLSTSADTYLAKEIVNVSQDDIESIEGPDYSITRTGGELELDGVPRGRKAKTAEVGRVKRVLSPLRFDRVFLADDPAVARLPFAQVLDVRLADGSGYRVALAEGDDGPYAQIAGYHTVNRVSVERDETETELEGKAEILARANEITKFNRFHGSWVYKVSTTTGDALGFRMADLTEPAG
jgi:hypothetical protein